MAEEVRRLPTGDADRGGLRRSGRRRRWYRPAVSGGAADLPELYVQARQVTDVAECSFYHSMDIPGVGPVEGPWDLRPGVDAYLGHVDLAGKRVLELGTADGYLSFHMERQGAEVVSFDLSETDSWDVVPYARTGQGEVSHTALGPEGSGRHDGARIDTVGEPPSWVTASDGAAGSHMRKLNNAYWLAHRAFGSGARLVHGNIYAVPPELGPVDVSVFGAVLLHTRDPFSALVPALRLTRQTVVVTEALGLLHMPNALRRFRELLPAPMRRPLMRFVPDWRTSSHPDGWWRLTPEIVQAFLGVLGFERSRVSTHKQLFGGRAKQLFTVVGHRTVGGP